MEIATAFSVDADSGAAVRRALTELRRALGREPRWILAQCSVAHDVDVVRRELVALAPNARVHGSTSCLGAMTNAGFHSEGGVGLGLFAIADDDGAIGVGARPSAGDPAAAAKAAIRDAIEAAERPGEVPSLVWLSAVPGAEESVVRAIESVVGPEVPIVGGSSADNTVEGHWKQFVVAGTFDDAIVVSAFFTAGPVVTGFLSGYSPEGRRGRVTRASGRKILAIDGRPAAQVYDEWTGGLLTDVLATGGNILARTTLHPLGREVGVTGGVPYFRLAHPDAVTSDGGLGVFADVEEGDVVHLMTGSSDGLVARAGRVAEEVFARGGIGPSDVAGALVIFCAGCMLTVKERMAEVASGLGVALGGKPFLGAFTFGEQGCMVGGENRHGNLMISVTLFPR